MITKKKFLRKIIYNIIGRLIIRTETLDDVLILTSSRSGSTWLNESLQNTKEFKLYNQPFDRVFNASVYDQLLPANKNNPYFSNLDTDNYKKLINFWFNIINGKIHPNIDWRFYLLNFNFFYKRKLIKSFFTKDIIQFYVSQPNLKIIYLMRNPIHRAISNINYGYKDFGDLLLKNEILIKSKLINTEELSKIYIYTDSVLTKHVISWYLENFTIYNYLNFNYNTNVLILNYEDMVSKKDIEKKISHFIFQDERFKISKKASKSSQVNTQNKIQPIVNKEEMNAIKSCLPDFMPYLNELNY